MALYKITTLCKQRAITLRYKMVELLKHGQMEGQYIRMNLIEGLEFNK